jgi:hypothetical protein
MSRLLLFPFLMISYFGGAQNLVPDPGFEIHNDPCTDNLPGLTHWFNANTATPDLWNMSPGCGSSITDQWSNGLIAPMPLQGNCYAGLYTSTSLQATAHTRDYLCTELQSPLESQTIYLVQFSVFRRPYFGQAIDRLGIAFTDFAPFFDTFEVIDLEPQIETAGEIIQADSSYWQTFQFYYSAQGGERFLTIGNFRYPDEMLMSVDPTAGKLSFSYYFFDNILLESDISSDITENQNDFRAWMTTDELNIIAKEARFYRLYDLTGRLIIQSELSLENTRILVSDIKRGVYLLQLETLNGMHFKKLWKK